MSRNAETNRINEQAIVARLSNLSEENLAKFGEALIFQERQALQVERPACLAEAP